MSLEQLVICQICLIMTINSMSGSLVCSGGIAHRQRVMDLAGFCAVCLVKSTEIEMFQNVT